MHMYDKWNFKPKISSIFHFEQVIDGWISHIFYVRNSSTLNYVLEYLRTYFFIMADRLNPGEIFWKDRIHIIGRNRSHEDQKYRTKMTQTLNFMLKKCSRNKLAEVQKYRTNISSWSIETWGNIGPILLNLRWLIAWTFF